MSRRYKIILNYVVGPLLFIWLTYAIYKQLQQQQNLQQSWQHIKQSAFQLHFQKLLLVVLLMPVNWGFEARKWQILLEQLQPISYWRAYKAILSGQALALNTPNRIGEYAGRIAYLEEGNRLKGIMLSLVGNMSQLIITFVVGWLAMFAMQSPIDAALKNIQQLSVNSYTFLLIWVLFFTILLVLVYYNLSWLTHWSGRFRLIARFKFFIEQLTTLESVKLTKLLLLSLGRYVVFTVQYMVTLQVFGLEIVWWQSFSLTAIQYLILASIPSVALGELGVRGQISLVLFGLVSTNKLGIVATSTCIWVINLIIPAIAGSLFLIGIKIFKNK